MPVLLYFDLLNNGQFSLTPVLLCSDLLNDDQFSLTIWSSAGSSFFIGLDYHYDTYIAIRTRWFLAVLTASSIHRHLMHRQLHYDAYIAICL